MGSQVTDQIKNIQWAKQAGEGREGVLPNFVIPAHYAWMQRPSHERQYNAEALGFALAELADENYQPRLEGEMRISPSSLGERCGRRTLFNYAGAPKSPEEVKSLDLMDGGSFLHLKWQMEGLSAGWLTEAETWEQVSYKGKTLIAKIDGKGPEVGMFELKTKGQWVMKSIQEAPAFGHEMQFEACCMVFGIDVGSILYLDRDSAELKEHRLAADPRRRRQLEALLDDLGDWIDLDMLPDMLEECVKKDGSVYRRCPYRAICPAAEKVSAVGALRS